MDLGSCTTTLVVISADRAERTFCLVGEEIVNLAGGPIVSNDIEAFVVHVEN